MHGNRRFTDAQERRISKKYEAGMTIKEIAAQAGCEKTAVANALRRQGIERRAPKPRRFFTEETEREVARRYRAGTSAEKLAAEFGCSRSGITTALKRQGVVMRPRTGWGARAANWKNGRTVERNGYISVAVPPDHPLYGMASPRRKRRVLEHRFVMAMALDRPLASHETVHHINGDRQDNRLENLQLRSTRHGAGVVLRCASCGSHDIRSEEL